MKCLKNCIFMLCSQSNPDLPCRCVISKNPVIFGETCRYENKTVTELNIEANYKENGKDIGVARGNHSYEKRIKELEDDYEYLEKEYKELARNYSEEEEAKIMWHSLYEKSQEECKELEKLVHLIHINSMFSTVKSFTGDVSKRYYYSEETDRVYDTANTYGQYDKILDKKEIAMLLNEYETMLNNGD